MNAHMHAHPNFLFFSLAYLFFFKQDAPSEGAITTSPDNPAARSGYLWVCKSSPPQIYLLVMMAV